MADDWLVFSCSNWLDVNRHVTTVLLKTQVHISRVWPHSLHCICSIIFILSWFPLPAWGKLVLAQGALCVFKQSECHLWKESPHEFVPTGTQEFIHMREKDVTPLSQQASPSECSPLPVSRWDQLHSRQGAFSVILRCSTPWCSWGSLKLAEPFLMT